MSSPHSDSIYEVKMTLFHRYGNNRNTLFPLGKQSVSFCDTVVKQVDKQ